MCDKGCGMRDRAPCCPWRSTCHCSASTRRSRRSIRNADNTCRHPRHLPSVADHCAHVDPPTGEWKSTRMTRSGRHWPSAAARTAALFPSAMRDRWDIAKMGRTPTCQTQIRVAYLIVGLAACNTNIVQDGRHASASAPKLLTMKLEQSALQACPLATC